MIGDPIRGSRTVTAMFDSEAEAERAVARLRSEGIPESNIRMTRGAGNEYAGTVDYDDTTYRDQHKGFWDTLSDFFFPNDDRYTYAEGLTRGSHLVAVTNFDPMMHERIEDILDDEGVVDVDARETEWRSSGWSGYEGSDYHRERDPAAAGMAAAAVGVDANTRGTIYDDGMQDQSVQEASEDGRRSQADLGGQQVDHTEGGGMTEAQRRRVRSYMRDEPASPEANHLATRMAERRGKDRNVL